MQICNTLYIYYHFVVPNFRAVLPNPIYGIGKIGPRVQFYWAHIQGPIWVSIFMEYGSLF